MSWGPADTPQLVPGVVTYTASDGSDVIVFDDNVRSWFRLPDTAAAIWTTIDGRRTIADIATHVAAAYAVDSSVILGDVTAMFDDLTTRCLVTRRQ